MSDTNGVITNTTPGTIAAYIWYLALYIQSPRFAASRLAAAMDNWVVSVPEHLARLDAETFEAHRAAVRSRLLAPDASAAKRTQRFWTEIGYERQAFRFREQFADALDAFTAVELARFGAKRLVDEPRSLYVLAPGQGDAPGAREVAGASGLLIEDLAAFKRSKSAVSTAPNK